MKLSIINVSYENEILHEGYGKQLGVAPGVPTMKGAYGDPENTKRGYNSIIDTLGNHDVPQGWIQTPRPNTTPNTNPGPPVSWNDPSNPDDPQAGYGYIPNDTTKEEIFFYHSDHLGSTSYITDDKANITQYDAYLPYGELLVDEHSSSEELPYKFNGKQFDEETGLYYYGARYMNPVTSLWYGVDPLAEKYANISAFLYCHANPIRLLDPNGEYDFEGTIKSNQYYPVIAVFQSDLSNNEALQIDYIKALEAGMPIMRVENMQDFADAMLELKNINSTTSTYTLNSHGTSGIVEDFERDPARFYIGDDRITYKTDFSILKDGLKGHNIFIGACNVGSTRGNGFELIEKMSGQTSSTVIASDHPLSAGYTYDGSNYLNITAKIPQPAVVQNGYIISSNGSSFNNISNVTIDKNRGISWDYDFTLPFYNNPWVAGSSYSW